jgi:hypothetical protein
MWLSIIPPPVGFGWQHKIAVVGLERGVATSPIRLCPSAVSTVKGVRVAASTVLGRIGSDIIVSLLRISNGAHCACVQFEGHDYFAYSSMRYASADDYLLHHLAKQRYVELPSVLPDHSLGIDMVYLQMNQLTYEQSINHFHLLRNFDSKD